MGLALGIAGIGLSAIFWNKNARINRQFITGFFIFSFLTICPGLYFREHYFVTLLPAIAMLVGVAVSSMIEFISVKKMNYFLPNSANPDLINSIDHPDL